MRKTQDSVFIGNSQRWAEQQFGCCDLGDVRRTRRVVQYAACQADNPGGSTNAVCQGDGAAAEGAYRMIRNRHIDPIAIEAGPFYVTAKQCAKRDVVLAVQDTMTLTISTVLGESLGEIGKDGSCGRGFQVHSTLAVDANSAEPIGLLDQLRWQRSDSRPGNKARNNRAYEDKESFKWEKASKRIAKRVTTMDNIITVCDREADIHEFLQYQLENNQRFVVRACQDRVLEVEEGRLWKYMQQRPVIGKYKVVLSQRGAQRRQGKRNRAARRQRTASMQLRSATVTLVLPRNPRVALRPIRLNVVLAQEIDCPQDETPLQWMILTTESVSSKRAAETVIHYYELRWLIEEFHKSWKSGCRIESRPVQAADNLERLMVITAQVAVRLLQLRSMAESKPEQPCDCILTRDEWHCLWSSVNHTKRIPRKPPTVLWALQAIAKLAGWRDTKQTGRIGWATLWNGWMKLEDRVIGWRLANNVD